MKRHCPITETDMRDMMSATCTEDSWPTTTIKLGNQILCQGTDYEGGSRWGWCLYDGETDVAFEFNLDQIDHLDFNTFTIHLK